MSKSSPITNRIQSALHMRASALKNEDEGLESPPIYADDQHGATVKVTGGASVPNEVKKIQDQETYTYDMLYNDTIAKGHSEEEATAAVNAARESNMAQYGTHSPTAEGLANNKRGKVDADGNPVMIDDPNAPSGGDGGGLKSEDMDSEYKRMSQYDAGKSYRGLKKQMLSEMRLKKKLGMFKGKNPETGKRWTRAEKLAATDVGQQIKDMNFEVAGNPFQDVVGSTHKKKYTKKGDDTYLTRHEIQDDPSAAAMKESPAKFKLAAKVAGKVIKKTSDAGKAVKKSVSDAGDATKKYFKEVGDEFSAAKAGESVDDFKAKKAAAETPEVKKPKIKTREEFKKLGSKTGRKSKYGTYGDARGYKNYVKSFDEAADTGTSTVAKTGDDLIDKGTDATKRPFYKKKRNYVYAAAAGGLGYNMLKGGGGDDTTIEPEDKDPKPVDVDPKPVDPPKPKPVDPPTPTVTTDNKVTGVSEGILVKKPGTGGGATVTDALSRSQQRSQDRLVRAQTNDQIKTLKLQGKKQRQNIRRANPTLIGGAMRNLVGGKSNMQNTNINNMGTPNPGYDQNNKKKKGQFGNTSRPGYNA